MENNLTSMVAFVLEHSDPNSKEYKMAKFLSQPLQLGFFVPCDLDGNVLEEPNSDQSVTAIRQREIYQQAKDRVLFEGFYWDNETVCNYGIITFDAGFNLSQYTVEDLITRVGIRPKLTASALNSLKA